MKRVSLVITIIALAVTSGNAFGVDYVKGVEKTKIIKISTYGRGAVTGDVTIIVQDTVAGCEHGYYITDSNSGKDAILSIALSAYHSDTPVTINAYSSPRWAGSSGNYCEIEGLILQK